MKEKLIQHLIAGVIIIMLLLSGCKNDLPEVSTSPVKNITASTAESGGKILSSGKSKISSYGVCWDTAKIPTIASYKWSDSTLKKEFDAVLNGLLPKTTYYLRAFAVNLKGTGYGETLSLTTPPSVPVLATSAITEINTDSAKSGGVIYSDGGSPVINSGICWDSVPGPKITGMHTANASGITSFTDDVYGLRPAKKYYVRAYATNSLGTGYGDEKEFTTLKMPLLFTSFTITEKYLYSASCNVKSISMGGSKINEYGVCWDIKPNPTTDSFKTSKPYAKGKFRIAKLKAGTKYYVRLYAKNNTGTYYGRSTTFNTLGHLPKAETLGSSDLTTSGAKVKARVNPGYLPTTVSIEYGETDKYGQIAKSSASGLKGDSDTTSVVALSGLKAGVTYHYRVMASNELGTAYGNDETFMILIIPELKDFSPIIKNYRDSVFYIRPPASPSKGTFTYTSSNPKIAVIKGDRGVITGSGICTITATQAPEGKYASGSATTTFSMNVVDIDGNVYHTVAIGDQDWTKENLRVTRYRNGQPIPEVTENEKWVALTTGAMSLINQDTLKMNPNFGALYNWYAVSDPRKICPTGWHVPTDAEWQVMERFLGMTFVEADETVKRGTNQGIQLKDSVGWVKDGNGTNSSEFSGLPAGLRLANNGQFHNIGADACWWTNTEDDNFNAWMRNMYYHLPSIYRIPDFKSSGFSVRCVRDKRK